MRAYGRAAVLIGVSLYPLAGSEAGAQQFGRNKVEYVDFDFKILETEHFAVYHYSGEEPAARIAARLAERWHARFSLVLDHTLRGRQPLILYGSHPEFAQTNVIGGFLGDGIGGVTESARRRIVMPFAPTLAETDRILGHEIAHAFQFDMARQYRGGFMWPLWAMEGMAQYLALGAADAETSMWLRDAVAANLLPARHSLAARKFSPYRYGHALWAYLAGRYGDRVMGDVLKARGAGGLHARIKKVTGVEIEQLFAEWRAAACERYGSVAPATPASEPSPLLRQQRSGRLYLGPSLSPDGRQAIFFSERDRVSLDLFLADATTGEISKKLATTAAAVGVESLQPIRSAGSWSAAGDRFAFAAIHEGQPRLVVLDMARHRTERQIPLPQFGQVLTPSWSPDGRAIAFSALNGGLTDIYLYELASGRIRQLTNDPFADLQPVWSPDGQQLVFVTDRFSTDLSTLRFGAYELAVAEVASGAIRALPALAASKHLNPQWSADGGSIFFVADPAGVSNVFRLDVPGGTFHQVTRFAGGVSGLAATSPAISVARDAPILAVTVYRNGKYELDVWRGAAALAGGEVAAAPPGDGVTLPPLVRADRLVDRLLEDDRLGLPVEASALLLHAYQPSMFLEALGPPYISSGGGPFGTFVRGGGSLLFSDLLGERKLALAAQVGNRMRDLALNMRFINRERRWNWGAVAEVQPYLRRLPRRSVADQDGQPAITRETHYFERTQFRLASHLAYAMNQAQRVEFEAGMRHAAYRSTISSTVRSLSTGRVLSRTTEDAFGGAPATVAETSAAFVHDTAIIGPLGPILGGRSRFEVASTFGELATTRLLLDHRRYFMPVKPYTVAARFMHLGQYGPDAGDLRLLPTFLGSRNFLRGYGWGSIRCQTAADGHCSELDDLLGTRLAVANLEIRAPLLGLRSGSLQYGPVPLEGFLFADSGLVWGPSPAFTERAAARRLVSSFGIGARVSAFGLPIEFAAVRALDAPSRGWSFDFSLRRGF